jgi:predicted component of type VI protein secretion system
VLAIDPHGAVDGLVEAFNEILDLRQHLLVSHGLAGRALPSLRLRAIFDMMQLDLTDNERAVLITALRRLVDFDPRSLSPHIQALKAILERLEPQKSKPIPDTASTG